MPRFLTVEQVLTIHARVVAEFGGDDGVRDTAMLESAVGMPAATFDDAYLHDGIPRMAGAYLFHLCRNHPCVDGNKRTALAAAEVFLLVNDHELTATEDELVDLTLGVASGVLTKLDVTTFFVSHATSDRGQ